MRQMKLGGHRYRRKQRQLMRTTHNVGVSGLELKPTTTSCNGLGALRSASNVHQLCGDMCGMTMSRTTTTLSWEQERVNQRSCVPILLQHSWKRWLRHKLRKRWILNLHRRSNGECSVQVMEDEFRLCTFHVALQLRMLVVRTRMNGSKPCGSSNKSYGNQVGRSKWLTLVIMQS